MSLLDLPRKVIDTSSRLKNAINVFSEIGTLKEVLVHRPGREIELIDPFRLEQLLFSAVLEPETARKEHDRFTKILKDQGVKVIELVDLVAETFEASSREVCEEFIETFLDESSPVLGSSERQKVKRFLISRNSVIDMVNFMIGGILTSDLAVQGPVKLLCDPMPNLYFTRDPFASVGNGITMHLMKYTVRQRETIFSKFIF
ncbi:arginine deiminase family protein [Mycoplasmopsis sturni]|uniref:arginine deiminase family protein n=1 Tax=Mycoplasmopsis sturni TaxID=39047 RepID=UPI0005698E2F|nr:arginine deiminase family protein [Mycoplasmopsis sturni]